MATEVKLIFALQISEGGESSVLVEAENQETCDSDTEDAKDGHLIECCIFL
jgi:hypothetical protein